MHDSKGIGLSERNRLYLNLCNLAFFLFAAFTGSVIQIGYHMHAIPDVQLIMGLNKAGWALLHKVSAAVFFAGMAIHCLANWKFIATNTRQIVSGIRKPFSSSSYWLFLISVPACLTAMASWLFFGGNEQARFALVETHDKLGWFFVVFGLLHIIRRSGKMVGACRKPKQTEQTMRRKAGTKHICLDLGKCQACWMCLDACPKDVLGKINIVIHKHIKIVNRNNCTGCLKCLRACDYGAIIALAAEKQAAPSPLTSWW